MFLFQIVDRGPPIISRKKALRLTVVYCFYPSIQDLLLRPKKRVLTTMEWGFVFWFLYGVLLHKVQICLTNFFFFLQICSFFMSSIWCLNGASMAYALFITSIILINLFSFIKKISKKFLVNGALSFNSHSNTIGNA